MNLSSQRETEREGEREGENKRLTKTTKMTERENKRLTETKKVNPGRPIMKVDRNKKDSEFERNFLVGDPIMKVDRKSKFWLTEKGINHETVPKCIIFSFLIHLFII
jgi:hypothetical protein